MRKFTLLAAFGLLAQIATAQDAVSRYTLLSAYDLDGEGLDVDQVIVATAIVDNGTTVGGAPNYTIVAQPDVCRLVDLTLVDTNLDAGTITVTGLGCLGEARVCTFAFTAGDDTGVKTLTCTDGQGAYFSSVTTLTNGVMTGESDETLALGYSTAASNGWAMYGRLKPTGPSGERGVDPTGSYVVGKRITTSAACSNTVTGVTGADDAFAGVAAGDLLLFTVRDAFGQQANYERKVTAWGSADSITIGGACVNITALGVTFSFKKQFFSTNPYDQLWIPVSGWVSVAFEWSIDAHANTGGITTSLECLDANTPDFPTGKWVEVGPGATNGVTVNTATGVAAAPFLKSIALLYAPFSYCRFGMLFGTGDDADAAPEDINVSVSLTK